MEGQDARSGTDGAELTATEREKLMREGVEAIFGVWAALEVMREAGVAGPETEEAIEDLQEGILEMYVFSPKPKAKVSQMDLEDMIYDFCSNELSTILEDGSVEQVADYCGQLFRSLCSNSLVVHAKLVAAAEKRRRAAPAKKTVVIEEEILGDQSESDGSSEGDDGDSDEEERGDDVGDHNGDGDGLARDVEKDDIGNSNNKEHAPEDDGWEVVGKKASSAKKKTEGGRKKKS